MEERTVEKKEAKESEGVKDRCTGKKLNPPLFQTIKIPVVLSHVDPQIQNIHVATPLHIYAKAKIC